MGNIETFIPDNPTNSEAITSALVRSADKSKALTGMLIFEATRDQKTIQALCEKLALKPYKQNYGIVVNYIDNANPNCVGGVHSSIENIRDVLMESMPYYTKITTMILPTESKNWEPESLAIAISLALRDSLWSKLDVLDAYPLFRKDMMANAVIDNIANLVISYSQGELNSIKAEIDEITDLLRQKYISLQKCVLVREEMCERAKAIQGINHKIVSSVEYKNGVFLIKTIPMLLNVGEYVLPIGNVEITIDRKLNVKLMGPEYKVFHPHVYSDGGPCWGGFYESVVRRIMNLDINGFLTEVMLFLESYDKSSRIHYLSTVAGSLGFAINESDWIFEEEK